MLALASGVEGLKIHPFLVSGWVGMRAVRTDANPIEGGEERAFTATLGRRGVDSFVVPVARSEWFKVARAVLTPEFWTSTCRPDGVAYAWYLRKVIGNWLDLGSSKCQSVGGCLSQAQEDLYFPARPSSWICPDLSAA